MTFWSLWIPLSFWSVNYGEFVFSWQLQVGPTEWGDGIGWDGIGWDGGEVWGLFEMTCLKNAIQRYVLLGFWKKFCHWLFLWTSIFMTFFITIFKDNIWCPTFMVIISRFIFILQIFYIFYEASSNLSLSKNCQKPVTGNCWYHSKNFFETPWLFYEDLDECWFFFATLFIVLTKHKQIKKF